MISHSEVISDPTLGLHNVITIVTERSRDAACLDGLDETSTSARLKKSASVPLPQQANQPQYSDWQIRAEKSGMFIADASPFETSALNPHGRTRGGSVLPPQMNYGRQVAAVEAPQIVSWR